MGYRFDKRKHMLQLQWGAKVFALYIDKLVKNLSRKVFRGDFVGMFLHIGVHIHISVYDDICWKHPFV